MNIKLYITFSFLFAPFFFLCGQTKKDTLSFRVVSYNVENLFDCRHDTLKTTMNFCPTQYATGIIRNIKRSWIT